MQSIPGLLGMMHGDDEPKRPKLAPDIEAIRLRDSLNQYIKHHTFAPGMIVRQKSQAGAYAGFGDNNLAIVIEVLAAPILQVDASPSTPYFRKKLDMIVGSIEDNQGGVGQDFCTYHVDSRHFEPATEFNEP